jgi:hypothetical protein
MVSKHEGCSEPAQRVAFFDCEGVPPYASETSPFLV